MVYLPFLCFVRNGAALCQVPLYRFNVHILNRDTAVQRVVGGNSRGFAGLIHIHHHPHAAEGGLVSIEHSAAHAYEKSRNAAAWIISPNGLAAISGHWYWGIPVFILGVFIIRPLRKALRNRFRPLLYRNRPRLYAGGFYAEALEMLSKHGRVRAPAQTPLEFALSLGGHPAADPLIALTHLYNQIRFGPPGTDLRMDEALGLLLSLRKSLSG